MPENLEVVQALKRKECNTNTSDNNTDINANKCPWNKMMKKHPMEIEAQVVASFRIHWVNCSRRLIPWTTLSKHLPSLHPTRKCFSQAWLWREFAQHSPCFPRGEASYGSVRLCQKSSRNLWWCVSRNIKEAPGQYGSNRQPLRLITLEAVRWLTFPELIFLSGQPLQQHDRKEGHKLLRFCQDKDKIEKHIYALELILGMEEFLKWSSTPQCFWYWVLSWQRLLANEDAHNQNLEDGYRYPKGMFGSWNKVYLKVY